MAKAFNLRKRAQDMMGGMGASGEMGDPNAMAVDPMSDPNQLQYQGDDNNELAGMRFTTDSLMQWLEENKTDPSKIRNTLQQWMTDQPLVDPQTGEKYEAAEVLDMDRYFSSPDKGAIADKILRLLPPSMRETDMNTDQSVVQTVEQKAPSVAVASIVEQSNDIVRKFAESEARKAAPKAFNLRKEAQSRALQHFQLFGPDTTRVAPSVDQVVNDWHIVERNKGWGKKVHDMYGVDYEMFWRQNIMDKYHREFRDKDGNWVGGYIRKRFEVDSNVPELNNMQLKPGSRHNPDRATLIEGKLEEARDSGKFNLRTAAALKKK